MAAFRVHIPEPIVFGNNDIQHFTVSGRDLLHVVGGLPINFRDVDFASIDIVIGQDLLHVIRFHVCVNFIGVGGTVHAFQKIIHSDVCRFSIFQKKQVSETSAKHHCQYDKCEHGKNLFHSANPFSYQSRKSSLEANFGSQVRLIPSLRNPASSPREGR